MKGYVSLGEWAWHRIERAHTQINREKKKENEQQQQQKRNENKNRIKQWYIADVEDVVTANMKCENKLGRK